MIPSNFITGQQAIELVRSGHLTLSQVIKDHQDRYSERGALLKAWAMVNHEACIREAQDTKDMVTEYGSPMYEGSKPTVDASVVAILRNAGAALIGKTTTHEFACGTSPGTVNAFDAGRGAGGSSVGSAVAVCDYQCHVAIGSQTTGSIIRPSSNNGVFGFKPTWGSVCLDGVKSLAPTFDTLGFQARAIHDIEQVCRLFKIITSIESPPPLSSLKIGFVKTDIFEQSSTDDMRVVWEEAKELLLRAGVTISDVDLGPEFQGLSGVGGQAVIVAESEIGVSFLANAQTGGDKMSSLSREPVEAMEKTSKSDVLSVMDRLAVLRPKIDSIAGQYDALITPSSPGEPGLVGVDADHAYVVMWTGLHVPMISMPGMASKDGLPIGLTMLGPRYGDQRLLQVAKAVSNVLIKAGKDRMIQIPAPRVQSTFRHEYWSCSQNGLGETSEAVINE